MFLLNKEQKEKFLELFSTVFELNDNNTIINNIRYAFRVRLCGRENCKNLIYFLSDIYPEKLKEDKIYFGNVETGFMNVENILNVFFDEMRVVE